MGGSERRYSSDRGALSDPEPFMHRRSPTRSRVRTPGMEHRRSHPATEARTRHVGTTRWRRRSQDGSVPGNGGHSATRRAAPQRARPRALLSKAATARVGRHRDAHLDDVSDAVESHLPDRSVTLESDQDPRARRLESRVEPASMGSGTDGGRMERIAPCDRVVRP